MANLTDEEFEALASAHEDLFFEMTADGELIVTLPRYSITGAQNANIGGQLSELGAW